MPYNHLNLDFIYTIISIYASLYKTVLSSEVYAVINYPVIS